MSDFFKGLSNVCAMIAITKTSEEILVFKANLFENGVAALMSIIEAVAEKQPLLSEFYQFSLATKLPEELLDLLFIMAKEDNDEEYCTIAKDPLAAQQVFQKAFAPLLNADEVDNALLHYLNTNVS